MTFANMRATGLDELIIRLTHGAPKVQDKARKVMHRSADAIRDRAKLYAPVDDAELEDSIHIEKGYEETNRRLTITIAAGGEIRGVDVDRYAALIHEHYESMKPGKNTIAKRMANPGVYIGEKFLDRAAADEKKKLEPVMIKVVTDALQEIVE